VSVGPTLRQVLDQATARLKAAGIPRPRFEARLLAAHALGVGVEAIVGDGDWEPVPEQIVEIEVLIDRRAAREPMSQILGWREFYGRRFYVSHKVLTPRPDSETLIDAALDHLPGRAAPLRILDLGTGSGCLVLTLLAECPHAQGIGLDVSAAALKIAQANGESLGLAGRVEWRMRDWRRAGWTADLGRFDLILANPPYIASPELGGLEPEVSRFEPEVALNGGPDGLDAYRALVPMLPGLLQAGGLVGVEVGQGQADAVSALLAQTGLRVLAARHDLAGIARCVLAASG